MGSPLAGVRSLECTMSQVSVTRTKQMALCHPTVEAVLLHKPSVLPVCIFPTCVVVDSLFYTGSPEMCAVSFENH